MQNEPSVVSVVIPCYNAERLVGEAIRSALDQAHREIEVIVIDDGSTDGSLDVIRSFGDRIRWETGPNRGAAAARNRGIELARGEFVQFLDADDLLLPAKIGRQLPEALAHPAEVIFCEGETVDPQTREEEIRFRYNDPEEDSVLFVLRTFVATPAPLHWKRNLQAVGGFTEGLPNSQEFDLHLRMACAGLRFRRMPESLFKVRLMRSSLSNDYLRVLSTRREVLRASYRLLEERGALNEARTRAFAAAMARSGRHCLQRGDRELGLSYFREAELINRAGVLDAYNSPNRVIYRCMGPIVTEKLAAMRRQFLRS